MYTEYFKDQLPTDLAFYENPNQKDCDAYIDRIIQHEKFGLCLILSKTIFYPQGGGQKGDKGIIFIKSNSLNNSSIPEKLIIKDTKKDGIHVLHLFENAAAIDLSGISEMMIGMEVSMSIDWDFRTKQMRLHSMAHLLHFFTEITANRTLPYPVTSDLQEEFGVNRYDIPDIISSDALTKIKEDFITFTKQDLSIKTYPDKEKAGYRYWECSNYIVPCGGVHLDGTLKIGDCDLEYNSKKGQSTLKFILK